MLDRHRCADAVVAEIHGRGIMGVTLWHEVSGYRKNHRRAHLVFLGATAENRFDEQNDTNQDDYPKQYSETPMHIDITGSMPFHVSTFLLLSPPRRTSYSTPPVREDSFERSAPERTLLHIKPRSIHLIRPLRLKPFDHRVYLSVAQRAVPRRHSTFSRRTAVFDDAAQRGGGVVPLMA